MVVTRPVGAATRGHRDGTAAANGLDRSGTTLGMLARAGPWLSAAKKSARSWL